jgi:hypothetical protein
MAELENNAYQDKVTKKEVEPLTHFLEGVQSRYGLGNQGKRDRFDPYTRNRNVKEHSLGEALNNIQMLREDEEEDELDDIGDVDVDADEAPDEAPDDVEAPEGEVPPEAEVTDADVDNEVDPEEGRIVGDDGAVVGDIFIGPGQRYFMGASTDPQMVIVSKVSEDYVWYNSFPFKKAEKIKKEIAADLFATGSQTWLKDPKSKTDDELRSSIESVLNGRPGERVSLDDYQFSSIQVKYTGENSGDLEPWKELETEYDVVVDSNLTNKQTYNLRMNNKELENFRAALQEKPVAERNFKIIRIVTEEREYMIEATRNPVPKAQVRELEEFEQDTVRAAALKNVASGYSAEGFSAGQRVEYDKRKWMVMDFVPFGEEMTLVLLSECGKYIAEFVKIKDVKPLHDDDPDGKKVEETPKEKEVKFPESDLKTGETQEQKVIDEEVDPAKAAGVLVEFINKDPELNKNRFSPVIKNLQRKRRDGSYDSGLAAKAFRVLIDEGASKYFNDSEGNLLGETFDNHRQMFPTDVREQVAEEFRDQFEANVQMGNVTEGIDAKIAALVMEAEEMVKEDATVEGVAFTPGEINEFKKFDNADVSVENVAVYTWDKGTNNFKVKVTKKPRKETNDFVYSAVTTEGEDDEIDEARTKDSESFRTQEDLPILRNFLTSLNLNEDDHEMNAEKEEVDTTGLADEKGITTKDVHPEQLMMGIKVEMEHTKDKALAKQIALDHLAEMPDYYTKLHKMEKGEDEIEEEMSEEKKKEKKPDRTNPDGREPAHSTTKLVNALPIRNGKKVRTEVIGDVRVRYKTFEEKRKEDAKRKAKAKTKGD